jgi:hypothetical protein
MKIKSVAITSFAKLILGGDIFARIKGIVGRHDGHKGMTGPQKREAALEEARVIGLEIGEWAINLGIELAVAWLRSQAEKR